MSTHSICISLLTFALDAQRINLIETVHMSTHNICLGCERRKVFFDYERFLSIEAWCHWASSVFVTDHICVKPFFNHTYTAIEWDYMPNF